VYTSYYLNRPTRTPLYTLSLHDALPISSFSVDQRPPNARHKYVRPNVQNNRPARLFAQVRLIAGLGRAGSRRLGRQADFVRPKRSEEHTSELQSPYDLVCRLLLEKKNKE